MRCGRVQKIVMSFLPKRPGPYVVLLLLAVLVIIVGWMFRVVTSPEIREAVRERRPDLTKSAETGAALAELPMGEAAGMKVDKSIDPYLKELSESLHHSDHPPEKDLEIVEELLASYRRAFGGNPVGDNSDFTGALLGDAAQGAFLSRSSPAVREGALVDRWGTPFWFHPNAAAQVEVRSAGPDRELFTDDDLVINPSPEGFGVTPDEAPPEGAGIGWGG